MRLYGAGPRHLLAMLITLAFVGYGWARLVQNGQGRMVLIWFVGAVLAHDLILFPLYRGAYEVARRATGVPEHGRARVPILLHLVVPAVISLLLLLVWVPLILQPGDSATTYGNITGVSSDPFLGRWALISVGLFVASALIYALRARTRPSPAVVGRDG